jgi:tryptophan halogenase
MQDNKEIIVLGGGTAGWITALLVKEYYSNYNITVIENEKIGVLGAGEGTVSHFIHVLDILGIPVSDLVKNCRATIKIGVDFINWNGDGTSYFHHFNSGPILEPSSIDSYGIKNLLYTYCISKNISLDNINFMKKLSSRNKVPFRKKEIIDVNQDPILNLERFGSFSLHFDARMLADYLKKIAIKYRDIKHVTGNFKNVSFDINGNIETIYLDDGRKLPCDFIFDCSGFSRLILGKVLNEKWVDYSSHLPVDTAVPFFIEHDNSIIPSQIDAIAMNCGWIWKTPVQDRYGCGYVFDSSLIDEEQAITEIENYFNRKIDVPKIFKFKAGSFYRAFVKNCFAVGLSQSFIEPLEATSIWTSTINLINFLRSDCINSHNEKTKDVINQSHRNIDEEILEFIYLHYLTKRNDTEFWKSFRERTIMIPSLQKKLDLWKEIPLIDRDFINLNLFEDSWIIVGDGVKIFDRSKFSQISSNLKFERKLSHNIQRFIEIQNQTVENCMDHSEFINFMKQ